MDKILIEYLRDETRKGICVFGLADAMIMKQKQGRILVNTP